MVTGNTKGKGNRTTSNTQHAYGASTATHTKKQQSEKTQQSTMATRNTDQTTIRKDKNY